MNAKTTNAQAIDRAFKTLLSKVHPDKVAEQHKAEATELMKRANAYREANDLAGLKAMLKAFADGEYFKETADEIRQRVEELKSAGKTRDYAKALGTINGWDKKQTAEIVSEVYGNARSGAADKSDVVRFLRKLETDKVERKDMITALCAEFGWKEATAQTLISYLGYMHEYAKQANS